jgi:hypothetical protein
MFHMSIEAEFAVLVSAAFRLTVIVENFVYATASFYGTKIRTLSI